MSGIHLELNDANAQHGSILVASTVACIFGSLPQQPFLLLIYRVASVGSRVTGPKRSELFGCPGAKIWPFHHFLPHKKHKMTRNRPAEMQIFFLYLSTSASHFATSSRLRLCLIFLFFRPARRSADLCLFRVGDGDWPCTRTILASSLRIVSSSYSLWEDVVVLHFHTYTPIFRGHPPSFLFALGSSSASCFCPFAGAAPSSSLLRPRPSPRRPLSKMATSLARFTVKLNDGVARSRIGYHFRLAGSGHPLERANSRFTTELRAGLVTAAAMLYIISVNASILSASGGPCVCDSTPDDPVCDTNPAYLECVNVLRRDYVTATSAISTLVTFLLGALANLPLGASAGLGVNSYFAFSVVGYHGTGPVPYGQALAAVFLEGKQSTTRNTLDHIADSRAPPFAWQAGSSYSSRSSVCVNGSAASSHAR